jgi:hypothetical protein
MNGPNTVSEAIGADGAAEIVNAPPIWNQIDYRLVKFKIEEAIRSRITGLELTGLCVAEPVSESYSKTGILAWFINMNSFTKDVYHLYLEEWEKQGRKKSPEFVRLFYKHALKQHIDEYLEAISEDFDRHIELGSEYCQIPKKLEEARLGAEECKKQWFRNCELETQELEHIATANKNLTDEYAQSYQIAGTESTSQEPTTSQSDHYVFRIDGKTAIVKYAGCEIRGLQATMGIKLLAFLITHQGQEFDSPLTLYYSFEGAPIVPFGIKKAETPRPEEGFRFGEKSQHCESASQLVTIKARLIEINDEIKAAEGLGYAKRIANLEEEKDRILEQVGYITARSRRKLDWDPESKKIINKYRNSLNRALDDIKLQANGNPLAQHLKDALFPFVFPLSYRPEPPIAWQL